MTPALYPPSSLTMSHRNTSLPLYFGECFASSVCFTWRRSVLLRWLNYFCLGFDFLVASAWYFFNESHSLSTAALASKILHRIFLPLGICAIPQSMCFCGFSSALALLLTFVASGFEHLNICIVSVSPKHCSLDMHGIEGTTHLSSFARASEITF